MRACDEVFKIAFPAAAIIREKHEIARARHRDPAREMNGADIRKKARLVQPRDELGDQPEHQADREPAHDSRLAARNGNHVILRREILSLEYLVQRIAVGPPLVYPITRLSADQRHIEYARNRHKNAKTD